MKPKIAVFDLDGTLVHTAPDLLAALNHSLADENMPLVRMEGFEAVLGRGGREMIRRAFQIEARELTHDTHERLYGLLLSHYVDNIPGSSKPFPGLIDALDRLTEAGFLLAICTNKTQALADRLISGLGLTSRFAAICGADSVSKPKPDAAHLLETIEAANGDPDRAIMVGDTKTDIDVAKAAGIPVIAVDFGYTDTHVREFEPSRIISHFDELTPELADRIIVAASGKSNA